MATADRRPARLGMMRLNAARLDVYQPNAFILINGFDVSGKVRIEGATITQQLNHAPDTCTFRCWNMVPVAGQSVAIYVGAYHADQQLFGGRIIEVTTLYEGGLSSLVAYDVNCIDPTWLLNRQKVLIKYTNQSATAIVTDIVARFTRQVSVAHVAPNLPVLDEITFTHEEVADALTRIAERVGGYWYVDYQNDLHFFLDEGTTASPITQANPRHSRAHQLREDLSQVATLIVGRGGGSAAAIDIAPGQTELPVNEGKDETWFSTDGGYAESGPQVFTYTGVKGRGGAGAVAGIGSSPGSSPSVGLANGTSHVTGANYQYAFTFTTGSGESLPGPATVINVTGASPNPPAAPQMRSGSFIAGSGRYLVTGAEYRWRLCYFMNGGGRIVGPPSISYTGTNKLFELFLDYLASSPNGYWYHKALGDPGAPVYKVELYRTKANGSTYYFDGSIDGQGAYPAWYINSQQFDDAGLTMPLPASDAHMGSVTILSVPLGSGTVSGRKIYRTAANGAQLKLLRTVADNTSTGPFSDTTADAALGANVPTLDTSGLGGAQDVAAGATELPISSTAPFTADGGAAGGWANIGNMVIRYSGIGTNKLIGIPPAGPGSITAAVRYGSQILVQPRLIGIPTTGFAILYPIKQGDEVTLRYQVQDNAAATDMAARFNIPPAIATEDGIIVEVFSDGRFGLKELTATVTALIADRKTPVRHLIFETRDGTMELGRTVTLSLTTPPIAGTFRIRQVTFSEIAIGGKTTAWSPPPLRRIEATNKLYAFSDLVRRIRTAWSIGGL
jgi:hypothetical protein